jgi:hypothetical protein
VLLDAEVMMAAPAHTSMTAWMSRMAPPVAAPSTRTAIDDAADPSVASAGLAGQLLTSPATTASPGRLAGASGLDGWR